MVTLHTVVPTCHRADSKDCISMICVIKERVQSFSLFVIIMISLVSTLDIQSTPVLTANSVVSRFCYKMATEYDFGSEDDQLVADIITVVTRLYKGMIDVSALYFSGIIVDNDQLLERVLLEVGKECFQIVKLLALYGPRMLQSPKLTWVDKTKKTMYIFSFLVVFWVIVAHERSRYALRSNISSRPNYIGPQSEPQVTKLHRLEGESCN